MYVVDRTRRQTLKIKKKIADEVIASETELGVKREISPEERKLYLVWTIENFRNEKEGLEYIINLLKKVSRCDDPTQLVDDNICGVGIFYLHLTEEEAISLADMDIVKHVSLDGMDKDEFFFLE